MRPLQSTLGPLFMGMVTLIAGCGSDSSSAKLDPNLPWYGNNRTTLDSFMEANGKNSSGYDSAHKPVAVFDWDNTTMKNDIGDATTYAPVRVQFANLMGSGPGLSATARATRIAGYPGTVRLPPRYATTRPARRCMVGLLPSECPNLSVHQVFVDNPTGHDSDNPSQGASVRARRLRC